MLHTMGTYYETSLTHNTNLKIGLGTMYIHTDRGLHRIKQFATRHKWLDTIANVGVVTVFITAILSVSLLFVSALSSIGAEQTAANNAKNAVLIPGVNDFIPLHATPDLLLAVFVTAAAHEAAHALLAFRADYQVKEWGVIFLLGVIPVGAYVKIPPEQIENGSAWASLRVLSAGITANYILFVLTIAAAILFDISLVNGYQYYFQIMPNVPGIESISFIESVAFWMAFLNINLAVVNSLPIYGLDGGHMTHIAFDANISISTIQNETLTYAVSGVTVLILLSLFIIPVIS